MRDDRLRNVQNIMKGDVTWRQIVKGISDTFGVKIFCVLVLCLLLLLLSGDVEQNPGPISKFHS